jgi:hypothetical protein
MYVAYVVCKRGEEVQSIDMGTGLIRGRGDRLYRMTYFKIIDFQVSLIDGFKCSGRVALLASGCV